MVHDKYIFIISEASEKSTDEVLRYLYYYNASFVRVNNTDLAHTVNITLGKEDNIELTFDRCTVNLGNVGFVWYRRGWLKLASYAVAAPLNAEEHECYRQYCAFYNRELDTVYDFLYQKMKVVTHINSYLDNNISKLNQLSAAKKMVSIYRKHLSLTHSEASNVKQNKRFRY